MVLERFNSINLFLLFSGKMKPAVTAKLCHQASDYYADAMKILQLQSIRDLWPKVRRHSLSDDTGMENSVFIEAHTP